MCCPCTWPWGVATVSTHAPFKACFSDHYSLWLLRMQTPLAFKGVLGADHSGTVLIKWSIRSGIQTLCLKLGVPSSLWNTVPGWYLWWDCVSVSPTHLDVGIFFFSCYVGVTQLDLGSLSEEIVLYVLVDSVCPWQEVSSGSSCVIIWDLFGGHIFMCRLVPGSQRVQLEL